MTAADNADERSGGALKGRRVAVTRPISATVSVDPLAGGLRRLGAQVIHRPLVRIAQPEGDDALRDCVARLDRYDWLVFTSANAVRAVAALDGRVVSSNPRVAAVGPATAASVERLLGWTVAAMPHEYRGGGVVDAMLAVGRLEGLRVLWPRARRVSTDLTTALRAGGAIVDAPIAYSTEPEPGAADELHRMMAARELDAITLTSPSAVRSLSAAGALEPGVTVAVLGPSTAAAALSYGMHVDVQPSEHTIPALVDALAHFYADAGHD